MENPVLPAGPSQSLMAFAAEPSGSLARVLYPNNPANAISRRFRRIRRQNRDIAGWLTIDDGIDDAVVQRGNTYYLRRDLKSPKE